MSNFGTTRAQKLVALHKQDPKLAEMAENLSDETVDDLWKHVRLASGVVGGTPSAHAADNELRRIRLERAMRPQAAAPLPDLEKIPLPPKKDRIGNGDPHPKDASLEANIDDLAQQTFPDDAEKRAAFAKQLRRLVKD